MPLKSTQIRFNPKMLTLSSQFVADFRMWTLDFYELDMRSCSGLGPLASTFLASRVARFFLVHTWSYQNGLKCTKWAQNVPNGHINIPNVRKIHIPNGHKIYQHFPIEGPPKFTQIGILGLKINHLATLLPRRKNNSSLFILCTYTLLLRHKC
jgi:hypothetical protein